MDLDNIDIPQLSQTKYLVTLITVRGIRIIVTVAVVLIFIRLMRMVSRKIIRYTQDDEHSTQSEREKRAETLAQTLNAASEIFAITIGAFMVLRELGMNITPLLTGAGIAGVALGLGAQSIVRDFLNGFFILMENQFRVGDVIQIDNHSGLVEKITLRTTILRDIEGILHIIPNGEIKSVKNLTYGWARVKLDVGVSYEADLGKVTAVLKEAGRCLREDPVFGPMVLESPEVLGIEEFGQFQVTLRVLAKTLPQKQWEVAREMRRRIKEAFDRNGIEAPLPHQVVINRPEEPRDEGRPPSRKSPGKP